MNLQHLRLLSIVVALSASTAAAADPTPRLSALEALGRQNLNSIHSDPRTGGPQGISISELPAADAYCQARQVDAIWAINAGSKAPVLQFDLAHPSHIPGVPGSRPFVSQGPISQTPGYNPRHSHRSRAVYPQLTQSASAAPQTSVTSTPAASQAPVFSSRIQRWADEL